MANLKRYEIDEKYDYHGNITNVHESPSGEWVKFDDIKELLNTSTNKPRPKRSK